MAPDPPRQPVEAEVVEGHGLERTGVFLNDEEWADLQRPVSHLFDTAVTGEQWWHVKLGKMALAHGLEARDDGHTRWAIDTRNREVCYATPLSPIPSPPDSERELRR